MEQLDMLWKYQDLDLLMDQYVADQRNSDSRKKLLKLKRYLVKQDNYLVRLDREAQRKSSICDRIRQECDTIRSSMETEREKLSSDEAPTMAELDKMEKTGMEMKGQILKKEAALKQLLQEMETFRKKLDDIREKVAGAKKDYINVKKDYDAEVAKMRQERGKVKEKRDGVGAGIEPALLAKYRNIKASKTPVLSVMENNQCGGCFINLASLVVQKVRNGEKIVECENCGRILYYKG